MKPYPVRPAIVALALALLAPGPDAFGRTGIRTRPAHAGRPVPTTATVAAGRATYGHYPRGYRGHRGGWSWRAHVWYPWLGVAYWPSWGVWYEPYPIVLEPARPGAPRPALIEIDVKPGRADLRVDGDPAGQARDFNGRYDLLALKPGRHVLEFSRPGYRTLRLQLVAEQDSYVRLAQELDRGAGEDPRSDPPLPPSAGGADEARGADAPPSTLARGLLRVRVMPSDAAVYLDGEYLASGAELSRLHGALPVAAGRHRVEIVRPGFRGQTREIDVAEGEPATVDVALERE